MNINTTGITIDGKTYRNLPEQVAYNKERIEELFTAMDEVNGLTTFDWTINSWPDIPGSSYYYGILPDTFKAGRRYLLVVPFYDDTNTVVSQFFSISNITQFPTTGINYIWLYAYGAAIPNSITFRAIDIGVDDNEDITAPNITIINHTSRVQPTRYNRTFTVPGSSWTSDVNTVKFNLGQLSGGYHIQLIPADAETIDYILYRYIAMTTPLYMYNGANTSITFANNDGDYADAPDLNFIVLLTPVEGMTQQYITMASNGNS